MHKHYIYLHLDCFHNIAVAMERVLLDVLQQSAAMQTLRPDVVQKADQKRQ